MQIHLEERIEAIGEDQWDSLLPASATHTVFQTYAWHKSWWDVFHEGKRLCLIGVRENNRLIALAPLMVVKKGNRRIVKFIGTGHADYGDFIYPRHNTGILEKMIAFLKEKEDQWDAMALDGIPEDSPSAAFLKPFCKSLKLYCMRYATQLCPAIILDKDPATIEKLLRKKSLKRHYNHFKKKGSYQARHLRTHDAIRGYLTPFFDQHITRRQSLKPPSLFGDFSNRDFYQKLSETLGAPGRIVFSVIESQGRPIAFHFGFIYNDKFIWYKPSFDISLARHSPGEVLLRELLVYAVREEVKEFDFTAGEEAFKTRFANYTRRNASFKIYKTPALFAAGRLKNLARTFILKT